MSVSADVVLAALKAKHSGDVFVPECKNGPTQTGSHRRLDAWVLLKTWSPVTTIGYEVKVSRSDWRRDNKIGEYAGLCHLFYVVAPKDIVPQEELPEGVGLMEMMGPTHRLVTRRKPSRREIDLPAMLMVYVLMCRSEIKGEQPAFTGKDQSWRTDTLRQWVASKDERRALSYAVSSKIHKVFDDQERRLQQIEQRVKDLERVEARIVELGFDPSEPVSSWQVNARLGKMAAVIDAGTLRLLSECEGRIARVRDHLEQMVAPSTSKEVA